MSSNSIAVNQVNTATAIIVVTGSAINFVLGAIGLVCNVFIFTRPILRRKPCSLYFFSSTCFNLFVILIIIPVRVVSEGFNMDLANYNIGICYTTDQFGNRKPVCRSQLCFYRTFLGFWYSFYPCFFIFFFGFLTLYSIRQHRQIAPRITETNTNQTTRRTNVQLSLMLTIQVLAIAILYISTLWSIDCEFNQEYASACSRKFCF